MSDSDEENEIRYGTPLEPYEEDEVPSKKKFTKEATDQYAVDAHGRRRFHGAFTGGFSAGYGNTVATPEGFTPATFKSSRCDKSKEKYANTRPEDFMDEEDRGEFGIAPRQLQTQVDFAGQKRTRKQFHDGPIPGEPVLEGLLRPVHETVAVKILKTMGWRPGQGTGARLTSREKNKTKNRMRVYGCEMPGQDKKQDSEGDSSDSEFEYKELFAPDDYEPFILRHKVDKFGLGYSGLSRHSVLGNLSGEYGSEAGTSRSHLMMKDKGKKVSIRGQAFGVGALEEDDEDIYATEDMSHYDFSLGNERVKEKEKTNKKSGSGVLPGFVKATKPLPTPNTYPTPAVPRGYVPERVGSRFDDRREPGRDQGLGRHELSAEARGTLLGETPLPPRPPTPPPQKQPDDPIAKLLGRNVNFVSTNQVPATEPPANQSSSATIAEQDFIPISSNCDAKVFKPFASNPEKQARYEHFVQNKEGFVENEGSSDRLAVWERNREMVEFEQAAKLYKPLTGAMGDRFTHASEPDDQPTNPLAAVAKSRINIGSATQEQIDAASKGLYGVMTRKKEEWRPDPLVSKRFNVPELFGSRPEPKKDEKNKVSYSIFEYMESSVHDKASFTREQTKFSGSKSVCQETQKKTTPNVVVDKENVAEVSSNKRVTVAQLFMKEYEKDQETNKKVPEESPVTETIEKFDRMELYKSIFLSDSEEEDVNENKDGGDSVVNEFEDTPKNIERNTSPPRGIFANINFDELNTWSRKTETKKAENESNEDIPQEKVSEKIDIDSSKDLYGPAIPEHLQTRLGATEKDSNMNKPMFRSKSERDKEGKEVIHEIDSSSSAESWIEAEKVKKHKKKKSKKHKSKHKKSKHKKKDR